MAQTITALVTKTRKRQVVVFALALIALLIAARGGASQARVLAFLGIFIVVATVWIRGEYVRDRKGRCWTLASKLSWGFVALGVAALVFYLVFRKDGAGLFGLIAIYFGSGALLMRWRQRESKRYLADGPRPGLKLGLSMVAVGLACYLAGAVLLGISLHPWVTGVGAVLLLLGLLVFGPLGLSVLAEIGITWLAQPAQAGRWWGRGAGFVGAAAFVVGSAAVAAWSRSPWVLLVMLVLGLLMVAQASPTQADIVAVVAILALMGVTPAGVSGPSPITAANGSRVLVALGDSYMSGEGASVYFRGTDDGGGDQCRRSPTSWAAMASHQPPFSGLVDLACSGATTTNVEHDASATTTADKRHSKHEQPGEPGTQLDQYSLDDAPDSTVHPALVVVTLGGNDAGFSTIGEMCVAPGNCAEQHEQDLWVMSLPQVAQKLAQAYQQIDAEFPNTPVVVTAYPNPIADTKDCGDLALKRPEREFVRNFVDQLDATIKAEAGAYGFYYLSDMQSALSDDHLQLCDPRNDGQPGINFIGLRSVDGPAEQRFNPTRWDHSSFHPNERGHAAMLQAFESWLATVNPTSAAAPKRLPLVTAPTYDGTKICDVTAGGTSGCRTQGTAWAERRVGQLLYTGALVGILAGLGAWWASVAFFGWRRRTFALRHPPATVPGEDQPPLAG